MKQHESAVHGRISGLVHWVAIVSMLLAMALTLPATLPATSASAATGTVAVVPTTGGTDGCYTHDLGQTDDGSSPQTPLGFSANFFGSTYTSVYVNNNGNLTFDAPLSTYTPFGLSSTSTKIIAPFFADVQTNLYGGTVHYGTGTFNGRPAFCAVWPGVDYFLSTNHPNGPFNTFQVILIDRSDRSPGDFDMFYNYNSINWETGDASGGSSGLGGSSAVMGFSNGSSATFELPGSGVPGGFLDSNTSSGLIHTTNMNGPTDAVTGPRMLGRYLFYVRNGTVITAPGAPTITSATGSGSSATLAWTPPAGSVTGYTVTATPTGTSGIPVVATVGPAVTTYTFTGLTQSSYRLSVAASNEAGTGSAAVSAALTLAFAPAAPTGVTATAGSESATVTWTAAQNNGSAITGYTVQAYNGNTAAGSPVNVTGTSATVPGLTDGVAYTFRVTATNGIGTGAAGTSNAVTPVASPTVTATGTVTATTTATSGSAATGAVAAVPTTSGADGCYTHDLGQNDDGSSLQTPLGFSANFFGATYTSVYVNNNGNLTFDGPLATFTPFGLSGANTKIIAPFFADVQTNNFGGTAHYGTGTFNGRPAFCAVWPGVDYFFSTSHPNGPFNTFQVILIDRSDRSPGDFDMLYNYNSIQWETGDASGGSSGLGGSSAVMGFSNGSSATFELPGSSVPGSFLDSNTRTGLIHTTNMIGLLNTDEGPAVLGRYLFYVRNGAVVSAPGTPTITSATSSGNSATVVWTAPTTNGGAPITGYTVTATPAGATGSPVVVQVGASVSTYTFTGLTGSSYRLSVAASNNSATGSAAVSAALTLASAPSAPTGVTATAGNETATVSWTAAQNNGSAITGYTVQAYNGSTAAGSPVNVTGTSATVPGLSDGVAYTFQVTGTNAVGTGAAGTSNAVTPVALPIINASATYARADGTSAAYGAATWVNGTVTVHYTCNTASCPADQAFSAEGTTASTSATANNALGQTATATFGPIQIDKTAPTFTCGSADSAWHSSEVSLSCTPADAGAGLAAGAPASIVLSTNVGSGSQSSNASATTTTQACDLAGNCAMPAPIAGNKVDRQAPVASASATYGSGTSYVGGHWVNTPVTVAFTCSDGSGGSGVDTSSITPSTQVAGDGAAQSASGSCKDLAGNTSNSATVTGINVDRTAPGITGAISVGTLGNNGWYTSPVTVHFTCFDATSGILAGTAGCPTDSTLASDGPGLSVTGSATDTAGNTNTATVSGIKIDQTLPGLAGSPISSPNAAGWYNSNVTIHWVCADSGSGVASCPANGAISGEGQNLTLSGTAVDNAGNSKTVNSSPSVNIDHSAPLTTSDAPSGWQTHPFTVHLSATDNLSGVAATYFTVNGGGQQSYSSTAGIPIGTDGTYTITFWSVDVAGNGETHHTATVQLDATAPSLSGAPTTSPNGAGWYNSAVTVHWTCADSGSGLARTCPSNSTISGEGTGLTSTQTISDVAGNATTAASSPAVKIDLTKPTTGDNAPSGWQTAPFAVTLTATDNLSGVAATYYTVDGGAEALYNSTTGVPISVDGIHSIQYYSVDNAGNAEAPHGVTVKLDHTAPVLTVSPDRAANSAGWYNAPVTLHWTCSDATSGLLGACPADVVLHGEAANLTAGATISDVAGNTTSTSSSPINIDTTAPNSSILAPTGWQNHDVRVSLAASDNLSGIAATYYTVNGGAQQTYDATAAIPLHSDGVYTIQYWSVDNAGNTETARTAVVQIDQTAPTITHTQSPAANAAGWNNTDVTVTFTCGDNLSGVASCDGANATTGSTTITTEGLLEAVVGTAIDNANNHTSDTAHVSIDKTAPTIAGTADRVANAAGWYNAPVTVTWTCADPAASGITASGVAACPSSTTLSSDAGGQSVSGTAADAAGNTSNGTVSGINIDQTKPGILASAAPGPNAAGWNNSDVTVSFACTDGLSGMATCAAPQTVSHDGQSQVVSGNAVDNAGNTQSVSTTVNLDKTPPTLTGAATTSPNAAGWYNSPVSIHWTCGDALSGLAVCPTDSTLNTDAAGQSASATDGDLAGNTTTTAVSGINIDQAKPTISVAADHAPNAAGWYNHDVVMTFTCGDTLSGVATCPTAQTVGTEGNAVVVSGTATDVAGNNGSTSTSVKIDKTPPTISGGPDRAPNGAGWYNAPVTVHFDCNDLLSGIAGCTPNTVVNSDGATQSVTGTATDAAGNSTDATVSGINLDQVPPTISASTGTYTPGAGSWSRGPVTVTFGCTDPGGSGVVTTSAPVTLTSDGANQSASGSCTDAAGNSNSITVGTINVDATPPTVSAAIVKGTLGSNGWYTGPVTVHFTCTDATSGPASCPDDVTLSGDGAGQSVSGTGYDVAGNSAVGTVTGINIDRTPPTIGATATTADGTTYTAGTWTDQTVTVHYTCGDAAGGSGLATTACPVDQSYSTDTGGSTASGSVSDIAGNSASTSFGLIKVDKTLPVITAQLDKPAAANGWYNLATGAPTVKYTCSDALSGLAGPCPSSYTFTEAPTAQSASGTVFDNAGNSSTAGVNGVQVDLTPPTITASATTADGKPYTAGTWTDQTVTVHYTCGDTVSGVAVCPPYQSFGEGDNQAATGTASDKAGNRAAAGFGPIKIDLTRPTISATLDRAAGSTGWFNRTTGAPTVNYACGDVLSGIANGSCPASVTFAEAPTAQSAAGTVFDNAGNSATANVGGIKVDLTAPSITASATTADGKPYTAGTWTNQPVTVHYACADATSGVAACSANQTFGEGDNQKTLGTATDAAGNSAGATFGPIRIDQTKPIITNSLNKTSASTGWYNLATGAPTASYKCSDPTLVDGNAGSGIVAGSCPGSYLFPEGAGLTQTGTVYDNAGNGESSTAGPVNVDLTKPTITIGGVSNNGLYNTTVTPTVVLADSLSGVGSKTITLDGNPYTSGTPVTALGSHTLAVSVTDRAGNSSSQSVTFLVYQYAQGGTFALGDSTVSGAASGATLTFWGAQWAGSNTLSGGAAPNSFKGFLSTATTPTCGGTFSADPGNSGTPPASLPGYMAVVVTSKVTQTSSAISGTITKLVVVKTNAGYANNPGHPGTGSIVATICG